VNFDNGIVQRVDPATGRERARVPLGDTGSSVAGAADGQVWAASFGAASIVRVDGDRVSARIAVGPGPEGLASGFGVLWTANKGCLDPAEPCPGNGSVTRVDPQTGATKEIPVGKEPRYVATGSTSVWVTSFFSDTLTRIDPATGNVAQVVAAPKGPDGVVEAFGSVWVAGYDGGEVWRYDRSTLAVTAKVTLPTGAGPEDLKAGPDSLLALDGQQRCRQRVADRSGGEPRLDDRACRPWPEAARGRRRLPLGQQSQRRLVAANRLLGRTGRSSTNGVVGLRASVRARRSSGCRNIAASFRGGRIVDARRPRRLIAFAAFSDPACVSACRTARPGATARRTPRNRGLRRS
jgi:streptogramin lyase